MPLARAAGHRGADPDLDGSQAHHRHPGSSPGSTDGAPGRSLPGEGDPASAAGASPRRPGRDRGTAPGGRQRPNRARRHGRGARVAGSAAAAAAAGHPESPPAGDTGSGRPALAGRSGQPGDPLRPRPPARRSQSSPPTSLGLAARPSPPPEPRTMPRLPPSSPGARAPTRWASSGWARADWQGLEPVRRADLLGRILASVAGRHYPVSPAALRRLAEAGWGTRATLAGCIIVCRGDDLLVAREPGRIGDRLMLEPAASCLWDRRWNLGHARGRQPVEVRALGARGARMLDAELRGRLRRAGVPATVVHGLPAAWAGPMLVGCPPLVPYGLPC